MKKIGIIGAMEEEVASLKKEMTEVTIREIAGMKFYHGLLEGKEAVVVQCGVGKVHAGMCTQIMADCFQVDTLLNTGIAGSLSPKINIGDLVLSRDVIQHDVDVTIWGYRPGQIPGRKTVAFPADKNILSLGLKLCREVNPDIQAFSGRVLSGDQFIADKRKKEQLVQTFGGICAEMEGAAIGQAAFLNKIPFLIIRAIADKADGSAVNDDKQFTEKAVRHGLNLVRALVREL